MSREQVDPLEGEVPRPARVVLERERGARRGSGLADELYLDPR